jgi:hypothetical protein
MDGLDDLDVVTDVATATPGAVERADDISLSASRSIPELIPQLRG